MKKIDNLREMKEYRLAMQVENALTDYGFDYAVFAASIPLMHPTLQQNLYKLLKECLVVMADDKRRYDDRNRARMRKRKTSWLTWKRTDIISHTSKTLDYGKERNVSGLHLN